MVIGPGMVEAMAEVVAPHVDAVDLDRHDLLAEQRDDAMQRPHPAQRRGRCRCRAPAHRLGPGEVADDRCDRLGQHVARRPSRLARSSANQTPSRSSSWSLRQAGLAQEAFERLRRRADVRGPLISSLTACGLGRQSAGDQRQPPRRRIGVDRLRPSAPARASSSREQPRKIVARPRLHPRRDLLATAARAGSRRSRLPTPCAFHPRPAGALRQVADAADIGLPLGDRDHAARLQRVEDVAGLDRLLIGRRSAARAARQFSLSAAAFLNRSNRPSVSATSKLPRRHLLLILEEDVAIGHAVIVECRGRRHCPCPGCTSPAARARRSARPRPACSRSRRPAGNR